MYGSSGLMLVWENVLLLTTGPHKHSYSLCRGVKTSMSKKKQLWSRRVYDVFSLFLNAYGIPCNIYKYLDFCVSTSMLSLLVFMFDQSFGPTTNEVICFKIALLPNGFVLNHFLCHSYRCEYKLIRSINLTYYKYK